MKRGGNEYFSVNRPSFSFLSTWDIFLSSSPLNIRQIRAFNNILPLGDTHGGLKPINPSLECWARRRPPLYTTAIDAVERLSQRRTDWWPEIRLGLVYSISICASVRRQGATVCLIVKEDGKWGCLVLTTLIGWPGNSKPIKTHQYPPIPTNTHQNPPKPTNIHQYPPKPIKTQ